MLPIYTSGSGGNGGARRRHAQRRSLEHTQEHEQAHGEPSSPVFGPAAAFAALADADDDHHRSDDSVAPQLAVGRARRDIQDANTRGTDDSDTLVPLADVSVGDRANQLALRFARMLARRQRARGLLLDDSECDSSDALEASPPRKHVSVARSKSCATQRQRVKLSRIARARIASQQLSSRAQEADERERAELEATIRDLRNTIASLEQSQFLADSSMLTWRTNRNGVAVDICRQYFAQFANGYDPSNPASATIRAFMASTVEPDIVTRDFRGIDAFLGQWQTYTTCYDDFSSRMCSLALIDDDDRYVSVSTAAEMRFLFSPDSLKSLYPHLFDQLATSADARTIAAKLYGRECRVAFDLVFHFNQRGRVFVTESRVHLASALLDLTSDPFAAMNVLNASLITEDGHWKTADSTYVHEKSYALPKSWLWRQ